MLGVNERMGVQEFSHAFDDFVCRHRAPVIHMESGKFLSESRGSARLKDIDNVTLGRVEVFGVASSELPGDR